MRARRRIGLLLALAALAAPPAAPGTAQARPSFPDVEDEVMCDTCNVPLHIAQSPRADQLRREIRDLIARGQSKGEIKATLKQRYGPAILALPEDEGFSLAAYLVPILAALGLIALLAVLVPRWRRRGGDGAAGDAPAISPDDERRLEDELARFDS